VKVGSWTLDVLIVEDLTSTINETFQ